MTWGVHGPTSVLSLIAGTLRLSLCGAPYRNGGPHFSSKAAMKSDDRVAS